VLPVLVTRTVTVLVSVAPEPTSVPAAAAPASFWVTPNQGSAPISNELEPGVGPGFGVATMVAVLPGATETIGAASLVGVPPLMLTEHHESKFMTVSVTFPPPASAAPPSAPPSAVTPESVPPELPEDPLDPPEEDPPELLPDPLPELLAPELPPLELLPPSSAVFSAGDELLLHATALAAARAPTAAIPSHPNLFDVLFMAKLSFYPGTRTHKRDQALPRAPARGL